MPNVHLSPLFEFLVSQLDKQVSSMWKQMSNIICLWIDVLYFTFWIFRNRFDDYCEGKFSAKEDMKNRFCSLISIACWTGYMK